eukprot:gnl/MRDRNA2_/MRDRNA2_67669_c0_seq1.p1 gnl/MRDRNA2_/MRDRNA2_67669_c0~~gnl/MRDRNA2_/MRDRNA2_67669_c0_seq1.p1  ORF type:complete len:589 (+),score=61.50 gnl/MRDRNA2_/MRDRNA2_67669_c0_seq1:112-1878(+)
MSEQLLEDHHDNGGDGAYRCGERDPRLREDDVFKVEDKLLRDKGRACQEEDGSELWDCDKSLAVAFSGGGVRSGAFMSGVLWALAEQGHLRNVTHLSAVSGGTQASASYASFILRRPRLPGESIDRWHCRIVSDLIQRSQRNAGYILSFAGNLWKTPDDGSSPVPRIFDGFLFIAVILSILIGAPVLFFTFYIVLGTFFLETMYGGALRSLFCGDFLPGHAKAGEALGFQEIAGWLIVSLRRTIIAQISIIILKPLFRKSGPHYRRYLVWQSLWYFSRFVFFVILMIFITLIMAYWAQTYEYSKYTYTPLPVKRWCIEYVDKQAFFTRSHGEQLCSDSIINFPSVNADNATAWYEMPGIRAMLANWTDEIKNHPHEPQEITNEEREFGVLLVTMLINVGVISALFAVLKIEIFMNGLALLLWPVLFIWFSSALLRWKTYGPITGQTFLYTIPYTDQNWNSFFVCSMLLAGTLLPFFNKLHRFVHEYFRVCLKKAFYADGLDAPVAEVAAHPRIPLLLFGTTLNDYLHPIDELPYSEFCITPFHMGCGRTQYLPTPPWMTLSKLMTLSCAAIDGLVLTKLRAQGKQIRI